MKMLFLVFSASRSFYKAEVANAKYIASGTPPPGKTLRGHGLETIFPALCKVRADRLDSDAALLRVRAEARATGTGASGAYAERDGPNQSADAAPAAKSGAMPATRILRFLRARPMRLLTVPILSRSAVAIS